MNGSLNNKNQFVFNTTEIIDKPNFSSNIVLVMESSPIGPYTRKLAAILFTDMVGYTAVMQRDEMLAIKMQKRHQYTVDTCVRKFGGEVKNDMGDGSMSILPSAYEVIRCAMEIQEELKKEPRVNIRVGIHIADILVEESGKVHGDGINIASRIETLGVAGAILFSKEVYNKIKNQPEFKIQQVGSFPFKNVEEPMEVYAIANEGFAVPSAEQAVTTGKLKKDQQATVIVEKKKIPIWTWLIVGASLLTALWVGVNKFSGTKELRNTSTPPGVPLNKLQYKKYEGTVIHFDNRPASAVIIDINGGVAKDTTDAQGRFQLLLPDVLTGQQINLTLFYKDKVNLNQQIRLSSEEVLSTLKLMPEERGN